ncbi:DUF11 domain-containing protein [Rudanella paleaurantiibacter]|nr:DUF11 domain-containing protein [Rudanella paleaurantiibacter]
MLVNVCGLALLSLLASDARGQSCGCPSEPNVVINNSFESDNYTPLYVTPDLPDAHFDIPDLDSWTSNQAVGDGYWPSLFFSGGSTTCYKPQDGTKFLVGYLTQNNGQTRISQTLTGLTSGKQYTVCFYIAPGAKWRAPSGTCVDIPNGGGWNAAIVSGGTYSNDFPVNQADKIPDPTNPCSTGNPVRWEQKTFTFTATGSSAILQFTTFGDTQGDIWAYFLDNISVKPASCNCTIPIPTQSTSCGTNLIPNGNFETVAGTNTFNDNVAGVAASFLQKDNTQPTGNEAAPSGWANPFPNPFQDQGDYNGIFYLNSNGNKMIWIRNGSEDQCLSPATFEQFPLKSCTRYVLRAKVAGWSPNSIVSGSDGKVDFFLEQNAGVVGNWVRTNYQVNTTSDCAAIQWTQVELSFTTDGNSQTPVDFGLLISIKDAQRDGLLIDNVVLCELGPGPACTPVACTTPTNLNPTITPSTVAPGTTVTLAVSAGNTTPGSTSYTWSGSGISSPTASTVASRTVAAPATAGVYTYTVIVNNGTGCTATTTTSLTVVSVNPVIACVGNKLLNPSFEQGFSSGVFSISPPPSWTGGVSDQISNGAGFAAADGVGFGYTADAANPTLCQNVTVSTGSSYSLSYYAGVHQVLGQTVTLQYYNGTSAIGTAQSQPITHILESNGQFGGPYSLSIGAAPATATALRVCAVGLSGQGISGAAKIDALCLQQLPCITPSNVAASVTPNNVAPGTNVTLNTTASGTTAGVTTYIWSGPGISSPSATTIASRTVVAPTTAGTYTYTVVVSNGTGCTATATTNLTLQLPCALATTATPSTCTPATNQYTVSGTISLTSTIAGTATITDGTRSTTVTVPTGATSVAYSLTGLTSGTGSHTVVVNLPGCGSATATYSAPASCTVAATITVTSATVCFGNSATLTASGCAGTVAWSNGTTGNTLVTSALTQTTSYTATCTTASATTFAVGTVTVLPQPVINLSASATLVTAGSNVTLTANGCTGTVAWSNGSTGSSIVVTPTQTTQTYSATCTTGPACFTTASIVVNTEAPANLIVTSATICAGSSATLTAAGCAGTVAWSNGTSGNTLVTPALTQTTSYTATCTTTTSTTFAVGTVTVNPAVTATISAGSLSICAGQTTTLTASGGATYRWSTGATTAAISVSAAGTYSVTATSAAGCSGTATTTVVQNPAPVVTVTSATVCAGSSATLTASGANSYLWSNGATTASIVVTPTATTTYSVTGTSSAGCSATAVGTVTVLPQPVLNLSASATLVTAGSNVTLTATGCTWTVAWSNGSTGSSIVVMPMQATQMYSATCTTGPACFTTASIVINTQAPASLVVSSATVCHGSSATLIAAGCAGTVSWSNGTSGNTLVTPALTQTTSYTATCTTTTSTTFAVGTVTVNPAVTATISAGSMSICAGQTTTLTASGGATYRWSTGATTAAISVSAAGTYSVTATSAAGCSGTATTTVVLNPGPVVTVTSTTVCAGQSATLTASGAATYQWSTGANTASIVVAPTATTTYSVTGTSSAGCSATATGTVTVLPQPVLNLSASATLVTAGSNVTLTATGCTGTVAWSNGSTGASIVVMPMQATQTFSVTCTTGPACFTTASIVINTQAPASLIVSSATVCHGSSATLTAAGCAGTVTWSNGTSGNTLVTPALTQTTSYTATCTTTTSTTFAVGTVTVLPQPVLNLSASATLVTAGSNVTLTANGCTGSVTWSNGSTGSSIVVTPTQTTQPYSATCTTGPACFTTASIVVNTEAPANLVVTSATICAGSSATLTAAGCAGTVTWSNGTSGNTLVTPALTQTTSYTATCTTTTSTTFAVGTVTVNPAVTATISATSLSICAGQTTTLTASGGATYRWSTGATTAAISVSAAGTYSVTATSAAGCSGTATTTVVQNPAPVVTVTSATVCAGSSATLTASGANSYLWSTGATTASIVVTPTATTTYSVTGTSSAGCSATATGTVTVLPQPVLNLSASATLVTAGSNVTLTATGCTGSVAWNNGSTGSSIVVMPMQATQTYSATCTTGPGCFTTASIVVNTEAPASLVVSSATVCHGSSATLTAAGCAGTVAWSNGTSGNTLVTPALTQTTSYTTTCTTTTGSATTAVGSVTVVPMPAATVAASSNTVTVGQNVTLTVSGCVGLVNWNTGQTGSSIVVTPVAGSNLYSATCTTSAGSVQCTAVGSVTVTGNTPIELPNLELNKLVSKRQAQVGDVVSFTIVLTNTGPGSATGVVVSDTHTAGMTIIPGTVSVSTGSFTSGLNGGQWAIASLPAGATATLTYSASITGEGTVFNTAIIPGDPTSDVTTCLSVPIKVCQGEPFAIRLDAPTGYSRYQWYLTAPGSTSSMLVADGTLSSFTATLPGSYSVLIDSGLANACPSQGCCPIVIEETAVPSFTALVKNSSCVGSNPQADGQITLVNLGTAGRYYYQVSPGTSFNAAQATPATPTAIPANGVVATGLLPGNYTVRVWLMINGQPACPRDLTVAVVESCACPTNVCVPVVVRKIR